MTYSRWDIEASVLLLKRYQNPTSRGVVLVHLLAVVRQVAEAK